MKTLGLATASYIATANIIIIMDMLKLESLRMLSKIFVNRFTKGALKF